MAVFLFEAVAVLDRAGLILMIWREAEGFSCE